MTQGVKTIVFPVTDVTKAKSIFTALLGTKPSVELPHYVGFDAAGQHVGLNPNGNARGSDPVVYWHVDDIRESLAALLAAGATTQQDVKDVGNGRLIASVTDADGNVMGLSQP